MMRIALADDQPDELAWIAGILRESGYDCSTYGGGDDVIAALRRETFDLVMVDWNMPRMSGIEVLGWISDNLKDPPPVILLTSRDGKDDIVHALQEGAIDYITKAEHPDIVKARVAAALRRSGRSKVEATDFGNFRFDRATQTVRYQDEETTLRSKEFELARLLFENVDRPMSRGYIMKRVWNSSPDLETRTLDMHISRVRSKLKLGPERSFVLRTVFGFGYRLDSCGDASEA